MRSLALADAWEDAGGSVALATAAPDAAIPAAVSGSLPEIFRLPAAHPEGGDLGMMIALVKERGPAWVCCDGYRFDRPYVEAVRRAGARVVQIDDQADQPSYGPDLLVNQNIGASELSYRLDGQVRCLLGPRYALLGRSYRAWRSWTRMIAERPTRLLLTSGGGAPGEAARRLLRAAGRLAAQHGVRVLVLAGPGTRQAWLALKGTDSGPCVLEILEDPRDVSRLFAEVDIALAAAGSTALQLCFMGVPSVLVTTVGNQAGLAAKLQAAGAAVDGGRPETDAAFEDRLVHQLEALFLDVSARERMSRRGRSLVDGDGAARVVAAMKELFQRFEHDHA